MEGIMRTGGFTRNKFPLTLYIWPSGKVGWERLPKPICSSNRFQMNFSISCPKDGTGTKTPPPCRSSYPSSTSIYGISDLHRPGSNTPPVERSSYRNAHRIIHWQQQGSYHGRRFVAFSKRINSVLVPESFLSQANEKYGSSDAGQYFFLWKDGAVDGPPRTLDFLRSLSEEQKDQNASPISSPAEKKPVTEILESKDSSSKLPSRIIVQIEGSPSDAFLSELEGKGYEINREFPEQDLVKKVTHSVFFAMAVIGVLFSISSIATFAASFRLIVSQASEPATNLLLLGFSSDSLTKLFFRRFVLIFVPVFLLALALGIGLQFKLCFIAKEVGMEVEPGFTTWTLSFAFAYCLLFLVINRKAIEKSVGKLAR